MPKLIVHHIFSAGVAALILAPSLPALPASVLGVTPIFIPSFVGGFTVPSASLSSWILFVPVYFAATLTDTAIDMFGHHRNSGASFGTRTWLTHAPYTAPIIGAVVGLGIGMLFVFLSSFLGFGLADFWQWTVAAGIIASFCHLIADWNTMNGLFITPKTRLRGLGLGNNNLAWCGFLVVVGIFAIVQGLRLWSFVHALFYAVGL